MNPAPDSAANAPADAPDRARTGSAAAFMGLLSAFDLSEIGPEGAASRAHKQLSDPLGLATSKAMTSASQGVVATAEPKTVRAVEPAQANAVRGEQFAAERAGPEREGVEAARSVHESGSSRRGETRVEPKERESGDQAGRASNRAHPSATNTMASGQAQSTERSPGASGGRIESVQAVTGAARAGSLGGKVLPGFQPSIAKAEASGPGTKSTARESILRQEKAEIAPQIAKGLASLLGRKGGSMTIQLRPEALGRVQVDLTIEEGVVHARLDAEHEQARQLLSSQLDRLRTMLEHRGLRVERLEIASPQAEPEASADRDEHRGGWRTPAEDEHRGVGTEADDRSPGGGDHERAWGGDPHGRAERRRPDGLTSAAEADVTT
ncbi:MAG: flagellar hook-length control protein FliK, partial [Phycisphaerales bacterium]|nr:flagellar hook-length control protein FliK [Phycisphaerales bacterium]